jgi:hypothetical protein
MASDYLERSKSANKSMGKKAKAVRRQQSRAANEAVAFVTSGPKETRGKYSELGVGANKLSGVAKALRASGQTQKAAAVESRLVSKVSGEKLRQSVNSYKERYYSNWNKKSLEEGVPAFEFPRSIPINANARGRLARAIESRIKSESLFTRAPKNSKKAK